MPRYKRTFDEAELEASLEPALPSGKEEMLSKLRNMWEFASFMQYVFLFGSVVKIDNDFDIEDLEAECLAPQPSEKLAHIGLQLLKYVSSHRGLTPEIFDEYTRRQYLAKAPHRNPFGDDEEPAKFNDFDVYTKLRVLQQLSTWTFGNADRIRGMMSEEEDQLSWRIEPIGWDKEDRAYFVLDDDRLYRRTDEPVPPPTPKLKAKPKPAKKQSARGTRASKRRKTDDLSQIEPDEEDTTMGAEYDTLMTNGDEPKHQDEEAGFGFTGKTWECVAVTLGEYQDFLATIFRTRDANEKQLRKTIEEDVLPIIEKRADQVRQKQLKKMRELENLQKLASAKRSSRLADKAEKEKLERVEREEEEKRQRDLKMAHEEHERQRKIEEGHESRRLTREQRLKEREVKRILHEEELAKLEDAAQRGSSQDPGSDTAQDGSKRISERQIKTQKERHQKELEKMAEEEDNWVFDCAVCGVHGENLDDGTHSIACERCNVWQHSKCHGFSPKQAEKDGFHFVCGTCKRKEADARKPKIPTLKLGKRKSPEVQVPQPGQPTQANGGRPGPLPDHIARQLDNIQYYQPARAAPGPFGQIMSGPALSPGGEVQGQQYHRFPPVGNFAPHSRSPTQTWQAGPVPPQQGRPPSSGSLSSPPPPSANGYGAQNQHQQQHQYVHHNAVVSAGGHPGYQPTNGQQMYNSSPGMQGRPYHQSASPHQTHHQQYYRSPVPNGTQRPLHQQPPPHQENSASPPNAPRSPVKVAPKASMSPPQYDFNRQPAQPSMQPAQHRNQNQTAGPPPVAQFYQPHSPAHSSSPAHQLQQPQYNRQYQTQQQPTQTPLNARPSPGGAQAYNQSSQQGHPSPAGSNANEIADDGMSGPWPVGSKSIPQKQEQSPVLPSPGQHGGEARISSRVVPPVNLLPSPGQKHAVGPQSVPVKKIPPAGNAPTELAPQGSQAKPALEASAATDMINNGPHIEASLANVTNGTSTNDGQ